MALVTLTGPAAEPVTLAEVKAFLEVDAGDTAQDSTISMLALAARQWAEAFTRRRFITQQIGLYMDFFPGYIGGRIAGQLISQSYLAGSNPVLIGLRYALLLPYPPVQSINSFGYLDPSSGSLIALTAGVDYQADLDSEPARLTPVFGQMWPVARVEPNSVKVTYTCGYGDASAVPVLIKGAILALTAHWYENRLPNENDIPASVKTMLWRYRNLRF